MNFIAWHYQYGIKYYLIRYRYFLALVIHNFSLPLLLSTLFAPWKRLVDIEKPKSFDIVGQFRSVSFNIISRGVGASVRIVFFCMGGFTLLVAAIFGLLGLFIWVFIPFLSYPIFLASQRTHNSQIQTLLGYKEDPENFITTFMASLAGKFILTHADVAEDTFRMQTNKPEVAHISTSIENYTQLVEALLKIGVWSDSDKKSLLEAATWWDEKVHETVEDIFVTPGFGRPGIGLDLIYGYTPTLDKYATDLGVTRDFSHHLIGRLSAVTHIQRSFETGMSVVLIGEPGVGKKTVALEFARRAAAGELPIQFAYQKILEFDYNSLFAGSTDINQKKSLFQQALREAALAGNIVLVMKDIHRITNKDAEGIDMTDVFDAALEKRTLHIIALQTNKDYEKYIVPNSKLKKYFEKIEIVEPTLTEARDILFEAASNWEARNKNLITVGAIKAILDGSSTYITDTPFPEKALELLDAVIAEKGPQAIIKVDDVNAILSEKTGVSFARLTQSEKQKLGSLEDIIHERLVNQKTAVTTIAQVLRSKSAGVVKTNRPIGSFLFLGPTGVGKTETAKVLAQVYFGSENQILRFNMAEYAGAEGIERLIGSVSKNQPGELTTGIKNKPASLLLLDEVEKAPPQVFNLFLSLLDEGVISDAFGNRINCQNVFVIATSNAGAQFIRESLQTNASQDLQKGVVDFVLHKGLFSPEFVNRFDAVVVYEPLSEEQLLQVAKLQMKKLQENMKEKGIVLNLSEEALRLLVHKGYDPAFGARPLRRIIEIEVGDLLGGALLKGEIQSGDTVELGTTESNQFSLHKVNN